MPYPQYWAWRLSGAKATEATSLGSHTDLWNPRAGHFSDMTIAEGWNRLFPSRVKPWDAVGTVTDEVAKTTGLPATTRIIAGIHDSNASLLPHLLSRPQPFAVLSTGTWMVVLAPGGSLDGLDQERDCLANVDAFGHAVPSSRFMAGREFETISGGPAISTRAEIENVIRDRIMALPSFAPGTGPFGKQRGHWAKDGALLEAIANISPGARNAVASLYTALIAETCLDLAGAKGPIVVEGTVREEPAVPRRPRSSSATPSDCPPGLDWHEEGALLLALGEDARPQAADPPPIVPLDIDLGAYAENGADVDAGVSRLTARQLRQRRRPCRKTMSGPSRRE